MVHSRHGRLGAYVSVLLVTLSAGFPAAAQQAALLPEQEAALRGIARGETVDWPEMTEAQAAALYERAERYLELYQKYHLPHGLNADVWWNDYDRSSVYRLEGLGDSAAWTGHYLAALALKHSITQDAKTRADILAVLDKIDLLTVVSGRVGYIARYAGPENDEGYRGYYSVYGKGEDPERPGLGLRAFRGVEPYEDLVWLGYSSRDTYDGVNFGLAITLAYVEDDEVLARIKDIVERVASRLIEDSWSIPDGKGNVTRSTPTYKAAWMRTILSANPEKYGDLEPEYREICAALSERSSLKTPFDSEYFANNLLFIRYSALCALEKDSGLKKGLEGALTRLFEATRTHLNPHFAVIYMLATGDTKNEEALTLLQGLLVDFPDPPKFFRVVDHRESGAEMYNESLTKYALLSRERVPNDFYWQRSPCLAHGGQDLPYELPGIDVFLPYWMGRVIGVIPPPKS